MCALLYIYIILNFIYAIHVSLYVYTYRMCVDRFRVAMNEWRKGSSNSNNNSSSKSTFDMIERVQKKTGATTFKWKFPTALTKWKIPKKWKLKIKQNSYKNFKFFVFFLAHSSARRSCTCTSIACKALCHQVVTKQNKNENVLNVVALSNWPMSMSWHFWLCNTRNFRCIWHQSVDIPMQI